MLAQLVQDLVHLERGEDRLDEDRRPDRAARDPERRPGRGRRPRSRAAPRGATRAWPGRGTGRSPPRAPRPRSGTGTARSRTGRPRPARRRRARATRRGASRAAGRRASRSARPAGRPCPRATRTSACRRTASASAAWPPTTFAQVGDSASSRSAMNTRAPGVEGVDHHLRLGRAGDLDPPVVEVGRRRGDRPVGLADVARRDQEVGPDARRRARPGAPRAGGAGRAGPARTGAGGRRRRRARRRSGSGRRPGRRPRAELDARRQAGHVGHVSLARDGRSPRSGRAARSSACRSRGRWSSPNGDRSTSQ